MSVGASGSAAPAPPLPPLPPVGTGETEADVLVIGAGVIGLSIAWQLVQRGRGVCVIDRESVAAGASRGNAGAYAFSDIQPLASPGIWRQVPRWLVDPLGPLALRPAYLPQITPWLMRFAMASRPSHVEASIRAQVALNRLSAEATPRLLASIDASAMLHEDGNLHLYETEAQWRASLPGWQQRAAHGIAFEHAHGAAELARWQPGLSPALTVGTFVPGWSTIDDPLVLVQRLAERCAAQGARLRRAQATVVAPAADGVHVHLAEGPPLRARQVVVAAGAWSHRLAVTLGERIPLETERGYNTTLPPGAFPLTRQLTFPDHAFVVTPIGGGVRVGGAVELGGLEAEPDFRRADTLLAKARRFLPGLNPQGGTRWMGFRPSLPDSLPAIGPARHDPRVLYAFGHGHLGLTQSAATAEIVAALAGGEKSAIDLAPYRPQRFS